MEPVTRSWYTTSKRNLTSHIMTSLMQMTKISGSAFTFWTMAAIQAKELSTSHCGVISMSNTKSKQWAAHRTASTILNLKQNMFVSQSGTMIAHPSSSLLLLGSFWSFSFTAHLGLFWISFGDRPWTSMFFLIIICGRAFSIGSSCSFSCDIRRKMVMRWWEIQLPCQSKNQRRSHYLIQLILQEWRLQQD